MYVKWNLHFIYRDEDGGENIPEMEGFEIIREGRNWDDCEEMRNMEVQNVWAACANGWN